MGRRKLTDDQIEEILNISNRFTAKQLAQMYNVSRSCILKLWMDNDYHKDSSFSYYIDDHFFSKINTEEKAYIFGFISADGCIYKREGHKGLLSLSIQAQDKELLNKIKLAMNSTHPIHEKIKNGHELVSIQITSDIIYNDLIRLGLCDNKTWVMDISVLLSNIPDYLKKDFMRGYFDGDGCIYMPKKPTELSKYKV